MKFWLIRFAAGNIDRQLGTHRRVTLNFESSDRGPNPREVYAVRFVGLVFFGGLVDYTLVVLISTRFVDTENKSRVVSREFRGGDVTDEFYAARFVGLVFFGGLVVYTLVILTSTCGLVATTSAQHAEGRQFDPAQV